MSAHDKRVQQPEWRCFHCDDVFTDREKAAEHFGTTLLADPACQIDLLHFRLMEKLHLGYLDEDTELHREIARLHADHHTALRHEEEKGYVRGLADGRAMPPNEWRPISEAPLNECVLICVAGGIARTGGPLLPSIAARQGDGWYFEDCTRVMPHPTHFRPLPAAPGAEL